MNNDVEGLTPVNRVPNASMVAAMTSGSGELRGREHVKAVNNGDEGRKTIAEQDFPVPWSMGTVDDRMVPDENYEFGRTKNMYDVPQQDELIRRGEGYYDPYLESSRTAAQQGANYPYQFMNHAWDNPRGNLNKASFDSTLMFSRLADKLNNRLRYVPGQTMLMGTPITGYTQMGGATIEKWPEIETEEMRMMEANRRVDERARNYGVDLQSRVQAYPQDLQEARDKALMGLGGEILSTENDLGRFAQKLEFSKRYGDSVSQFFAKDIEKFRVNLGLSTTARVTEYVTSTLAPWAAQMFLNIYQGAGAAVPGKDIRILQTLKDRVWRDNNIPYDEKTPTYALMAAAMGFSATEIFSGQILRGLTPAQLRQAEEVHYRMSAQQARNSGGTRLQ